MSITERAERLAANLLADDFNANDPSTILVRAGLAERRTSIVDSTFLFDALSGMVRRRQSHL